MAKAAGIDPARTTSLVAAVMEGGRARPEREEVSADGHGGA